MPFPFHFNHMKGWLFSSDLFFPVNKQNNSNESLPETREAGVSPIIRASLPSEHHCSGHALILNTGRVFFQDHFIPDNSSITQNENCVPPSIILLIIMSFLGP